MPISSFFDGTTDKSMHYKYISPLIGHVDVIITLQEDLHDGGGLLRGPSVLLIN